MRKLCSIQTVKDIQPIVGADLIEQITILGWHLVAKKGEFKVGDSAIFFEIDSKLKPIEAYAFMEPRKYKVKTAKFLSVISQGLALPLSILKMEGVLEEGWTFSPEKNMVTSVLMNVELVEDTDLSEIMGIEKYDNEEGETLQSANRFKLDPKKSKLANKIAYWKYRIKTWLKKFHTKSKGGNFPTHLCPKTDEHRIQSYSENIVNSLNGKSFTQTVKVDGSSLTIIKHKKDVIVCSRNLALPEKKQDKFWKAVYKYDLKSKIKTLNRNIALQMEIIGEGIQGNRYKLKGVEVRLFKVYDIDKRKYLKPVEMVEIANKLDIPHVPIVNNDFIYNHTVDELVALATVKSVENPSTNEEGFVFVLNDENRNFSFKVINPLYEIEKGKEKDDRKKVKTEAE